MSRDVAEPEPVRCVGSELPLHEVFVRGRVRLPTSAFAAMRNPDQPICAHQPRDKLARDVDAEPQPQFGQHPRRAVGCSRVGVDPPDRGRVSSASARTRADGDRSRQS